MVQLTAPYIPGFLAFREADFLVEKVRKLRTEQPELLPQVIPGSTELLCNNHDNMTWLADET